MGFKIPICVSDCSGIPAAAGYNGKRDPIGV